MKRTFTAAAATLFSLCTLTSQAQSVVADSEKTLFVRGKLEILEPGGKGKKKKVIEHKDEWGVKRYRIPDITYTPDGRIVVAIIGRCSVGGDHGKSTTFFAVSKDKGNTWEYIRSSTDYSNIAGRPATDFPMTERTQESQVIWYPAMNKFVATYLTKNAAWFVTSDDLKTWSKPVKASFKGDKNLAYWPSPSSIQIDNDGSLMMAITGSEKVDGKKERFARLLWTKDLKTFSSSSNMPCDGNETAVSPIGGGKYFVTTRISPKRLNMSYDKATDKWSTPTPFPAPAHWRCEVDILNHNGTLYLTTPTKGRSLGTLYKSTDKGQRWQKVIQLTEGAFAYSAITAIDKNTLAIVSEQENGDITFQKVNLIK